MDSLRCYQYVRSRLFEGEPEVFCDWELKNNLLYLKNKSLLEHKLIHRTGNIFMGLRTKLKYNASLKIFKSISSWFQQSIKCKVPPLWIGPVWLHTSMKLAQHRHRAAENSDGTMSVQHVGSSLLRTGQSTTKQRKNILKDLKHNTGTCRYISGSSSATTSHNVYPF